MKSSNYHSQDFSYHSPSLRAPTGLAAVSSPANAHHETLPQHEFHEQQQGRIQNQLQYGNHHKYQNDSYYHSTATTGHPSLQHIHTAATPQTPDETFLSKSPYSNVEQAGKDILRSARQKLDARRKSRPISVEQKTAPPPTTTALEGGQNQSSPRIRALKRQLWSDDEQLQRTPVSTKSQHTAITQLQTQDTEQNSTQTAESPSLSQRSYRSLSPARVPSGLMNQSNGSVDSKLTATTTPTKTMNTSNGHGGPLFHSKYYAAARAARLRDQKEKSSPLFSGTGNVSKLPQGQGSQSRSHLNRSRSISRSFSSTNASGVSKQQETASKHEESHLRSNSERSRSLSRSFLPVKESTLSISAPQYEAMSSRQSSGPLQNSSRRARYLSRSFSSTNETAVSTRTADSKQQTKTFSHQASPLLSSQRASQSVPPRQKSDLLRTPSSPQTMMSTSSPATSSSPSTTSEKEHRLNTGTSERGRLANMALERGLASRNGRSQSPFVDKRMRSFSQNRRQTSPLKPSNEKSQRSQQIQQPQRNVGEGKEASLEVAEKTATPRGASARGERSNVATFWNGKISRVTSNPKGSIENPQKPTTTEQKDKESNLIETKPSSLELMAKLQAVDRANPAQALAQIDFILREEGRKTSFEPILINPDIVNDDDSAGTTISSLTNPDYRDWQHQQQMRANQHMSNQNTPTAISSFRRPRPSSLQNYSANSLPKEKSSPHIPNLQKQPQPFPTTPLEKSRARQLAKLANSYRDVRPNSNSRFDKMAKDATTSPLPRPSPLPTRRSHPWDGDAPNAESMNFSVESKEERPVTVDAGAEVAQPDQHVCTPSKPQRENNEVKKESCADPSAKSDEAFNVKSKGGDFITNPPMSKVSTPRITPQQYENTRKISDNFDAAWALMPESGFAPTVRTKARQGLGSQSSRSSRTLDFNSSFDTSTNGSKSYHSRSVSLPEDDSNGVNGERFSIEVSLVRPTEAPKKGAGKPKSRKRGFLRSFVRRKNGKKGTTSSTNSESQNSTGIHSGSQSSSGAKSYSTPSSMPSARSSSVVSPPSIRNESRRHSPMKDPKNPEFRTASMAKKYSRVMRLYDDD